MYRMNIEIIFGATNIQYAKAGENHKMKKQKQVRCKRCGQPMDSGYYAEHLVKFHYDFSELKNSTPCVL